TPLIVVWAVIYGLIVVTASLLVDFAINVITGGRLPGPLASVQWLAWPALVVLFLASAVAGVGQALRQTVGRRLAPAPDRPMARGNPPRYLPPNIGEFTGRDRDLEALRTLARAPAAGSRSPLVAIVTGPPGSGKSALAVRFAHEMAAQYPDAQLYIDL